MPIDPNIALSYKPIQIQSPLEQMQQVAQIKSMSDLGQMRGLQLQQAQREAGDQQALRQAYAENTTLGPDGAPVINKAGLLSALAAHSPQAAVQEQQKLQQQSLDQITKQHAIGKDLVFSIHDQASQNAAIQQAKAVGLPPLENQLPAQFDPAAVQRLQMASLDAGEKIDQANKDREFQFKQLEHQDRQADIKVKRDELSQNKQGQALYQTQQMLESARGNPAVQQAQKDLYAAKKFDSLVNLYGDPDKLNPAQVQLAATEVAKIASGGIPSNEELKGLNPSTIPSGLASLAQKVSNNPQGAEAGAFVKALGDYVGALKNDAISQVRDKYGRVIETQRGRVGDANYKTLKSQYLDPMEQMAKSGATAPSDNTPIGTTAKTKSGVPVVYKGNGQWAPQ